jgi:hypothetical protein
MIAAARKSVRWEARLMFARRVCIRIFRMRPDHSSPSLFPPDLRNAPPHALLHSRKPPHDTNRASLGIVAAGLVYQEISEYRRDPYSHRHPEPLFFLPAAVRLRNSQGDDDAASSSGQGSTVEPSQQHAQGVAEQGQEKASFFRWISGARPAPAPTPGARAGADTSQGEIADLVQRALKEKK